MQILLSCAKDMTEYSKITPSISTLPLFQQEANENVLDLINYSTEELQSILHCNNKLAVINQFRYKTFFDREPRLQAILSYNGTAFKHLDATSFSEKDFTFANQHLWITSFLYGILRPMDQIKNYRLEGNVRLPCHNYQTMFEFWKPKLTDTLIRSVQEDDGILVHCATEEMTHLFDWKRVKQEVQIIEPQFCVKKDKQYKTITIYAKMCRGAMARYIIQHQCKTPKELFYFNHEGYHFNPIYSTDHPDILRFIS